MAYTSKICMPHAQYAKGAGHFHELQLVHRIHQCQQIMTVICNLKTTTLQLTIVSAYSSFDNEKLALFIQTVTSKKYSFIDL